VLLDLAQVGRLFGFELLFRERFVVRWIDRGCGVKEGFHEPNAEHFSQARASAAQF